MPQYRDILFCTDFSENADRAFEEAVSVAQLTGANLHVLHVVPPSPHLLRVGIRGRAVGELDRSEASEWAADEARVTGHIRRAYGGPTRQGIEPAVRNGHEAREILEFAAEQGADLIVIGARGVGAFVGLFGGGSVADKVVRNSRVPVLVVPS